MLSVVVVLLAALLAYRTPPPEWPVLDGHQRGCERDSAAPPPLQIGVLGALLPSAAHHPHCGPAGGKRVKNLGWMRWQVGENVAVTKQYYSNELPRIPSKQIR